MPFQTLGTLPDAELADTAVTVAPFTVLAVCAGNICRSPMLESLLETRLESAIRDRWPGADLALGREKPLALRSAGTEINPALEQPELVGEQLRRLGAPSHAERAPIAVSAEELADVDLVLTMTREQRGVVVRTQPRMISRAFTLVEFARIIESMVAMPKDSTSPAYTSPHVAEFLRATSLRAARRRGMVPPPADPTQFDITDPYRRSAAVYASVADSIARSVDGIVEGFTTLATR